MKVDPNLLQVLEDVEKDERSRLFRVRPRQWMDAVRGERLVVSPEAVRLSSAERELLAVHRSELGYLLRCHVIYEVQDSEAARSGRAYTDFDMPARDEWFVRVQGLLGVRPRPNEELRRCLEPTAHLSDDQRILRAALAALQFEEHTSPRTYVTYALMLLGELERARQHVLLSLDGAMANQERFLWQQLGHVESELGLVPQSLATLEKAMHRFRADSGLVANALVQSVLLCDRRRVSHYVPMLDSLDCTRSIEAVETALLREGQEHSWHRDVVEFARQEAGGQLSQAWRIVRAFAHL